MSDKKRNTFALPASKSSTAVKVKRPSTVNLPSGPRARIPQSVIKERQPPSIRAKINKNTTVIGDGDVTITSQDALAPEFEDEYRQIAYGKFLRAMLEDCLVNEKISREETQIDVQMAQLAMRFQQTVNLLDETNRRVKEVSFVAEQKRLLDMKNNDTTKFFESVEKSDVQELMNDLTRKEMASLDRLDTKNVDFGYNKESGHQQLLNALNDALTGLEEIKKHSKLDVGKFKEYEQTQKNLDDISKDRMDLDTLKKDFEAKFPKFGEKLLKDASEKIAKMLEECNEQDNDDDTVE